MSEFGTLYNIQPLDDTEPWYTKEAQKRWDKSVNKVLWSSFEENMGHPNTTEKRVCLYLYYSFENFKYERNNTYCSDVDELEKMRMEMICLLNYHIGNRNTKLRKHKETQ